MRKVVINEESPTDDVIIRTYEDASQIKFVPETLPVVFPELKVKAGDVVKITVVP